MEVQKISVFDENDGGGFRNFCLLFTDVPDIFLADIFLADIFLADIFLAGIFLADIFLADIFLADICINIYTRSENCPCFLF